MQTLRRGALEAARGGGFRNVKCNYRVIRESHLCGIRNHDLYTLFQFNVYVNNNYLYNIKDTITIIRILLVIYRIIYIYI